MYYSGLSREHCTFLSFSPSVYIIQQPRVVSEVSWGIPDTIVQSLPVGNGTFIRFNRHGSQTNDRCRAHQDLDDAFITMKPGMNLLYVCNAEALTDIFRRGSDFPRTLEIIGETSVAGLHIYHFTSCRADLIMPEMLNVFGPNVSTVPQPQ